MLITEDTNKEKSHKKEETNDILTIKLKRIQELANNKANILEKREDKNELK